MELGPNTLIGLPGPLLYQVEVHIVMRHRPVYWVSKRYHELGAGQQLLDAARG